jgi:putative proteasome-type protease
MTYCLGIFLKSGLVLASDSRSNAGVDQVTHVRKLNVLPAAPGCCVVILSAGNLATTQAVVSTLREKAGSGPPELDIVAAKTLFDVATVVGAVLRAVVERDGRYVAPYGDAGAGFLLAGQMAGEGHRLFQIYEAGNFVEATDRSPFLQIGETKYGKPILVRALAVDTSLEEAAKLALLSFDATLRSNVSVGMPIDILTYESDSFSTDGVQTIEVHDPYWMALREAYGTGLAELIDTLPVR